jgi:cell division protein FtsL
MRSQGSPLSPQRAAVLFLLLITVVATSAAICQIWTRLRAIEYGYKISRATSENGRLREQNRRLRLELALLKNPARISKMALEELGLVHPRAEQIRRLRGHAPPRETATVARVLR